jgi:hypothetical protein
MSCDEDYDDDPGVDPSGDEERRYVEDGGPVDDEVFWAS